LQTSSACVIFGAKQLTDLKERVAERLDPLLISTSDVCIDTALAAASS
jgi:hypothetical protein